MELDLSTLEREVQHDAAQAKSGHAARTLIRTEDLRVLLNAMRAGSHIAEHAADETATIHVLSGQLRLQLPDRVVELDQGRLFVLPPRLRHDVRAVTDSAFLLTLAWSAESGKPAQG